jgi:hypothetical protein
MTRNLALLVFLTFSLVASAETFRLRNGSTVNGTIKRGGGGSVIIETANGVATYSLLDFDDATRTRLIQYDTPLATPAPAPAPPVRPRVVAQVQPAPPSEVEKEELDESQTVTTSKLPRSREALQKQLSELKGPARIVFWAGFGLSAIGGLWFLIRGFKESVLWGLGMILCGVVSLVFLIVHWSRAKDPFFLQLVGLAVMLFALVVMS